MKQLGRGELKVLAEKRNFSKTLAAGTRTVRSDDRAIRPA